MKSISELLEGNCFVYIQGNDVDIEKLYELVGLSKESKLILYPERAMTFVDTVCYRPYVKSVVTENPWIIACYDRKNVWVLRNGEWQHPSIQTFGASESIITDDILGYTRSIPAIVLGGLEEIEKYREKIRTNNFKD